MHIHRVIPCLLLYNGGLAKTVRFRDPRYVGDPINAVRIFNDKEVDELIFLDIEASKKNTEPPYSLLSDIAGECFMPLCYGGGIRSLDQIDRIIQLGVEKVSLNTAVFENPGLVTKAAGRFGSSTIVVSMDVKKNFLGKYHVYVRGGTESTRKDPVEYAVEAEKLGAGEILLNSVDRDGVMGGMDTEMIRKVSSAVSIPVIACGGAGSLDHMRDAVKQGGASAVAAGSYFVFYGKHRAVLISYPGYEEVRTVFQSSRSDES